MTRSCPPRWSAWTSRRPTRSRRPASGSRRRRPTGAVRFREPRLRRRRTRSPRAASSARRTASGSDTNAAVTVPRADLVGLEDHPEDGLGQGDRGRSRAGGQRRAEHASRRSREARTGTFLNVTNPDRRPAARTRSSRRSPRRTSTRRSRPSSPRSRRPSPSASTDPSIAPAGRDGLPRDRRARRPRSRASTRRASSDQEVATFDLGLSAPATVTTVNEAPVEAVVADRLRASVDADHRLVDGSIDVVVEPAVVDGDEISFPASATARAGRDPRPGRAQGAGASDGRSRRPARSWSSSVRSSSSVWPDWVTTIPTLDGRVDAQPGRGGRGRDARPIGRP